MIQDVIADTLTLSIHLREDLWQRFQVLPTTVEGRARPARTGRGRARFGPCQPTAGE